MSYFGFDHHKRWTQVAATDADGVILREGRVLNTCKALRDFIKDLPKPWKGVVEAGPTWAWIHDTLEEMGVEMIVAHPLKVRAIAEAKVKTDKIDARMLAHLLRADLIPRIHVPNATVREQKDLWRERIWLVRMSVRVKNRIQRLLAHHHVETPEFSDLFGIGGRKFLAGAKLPPNARKMLDTELQILDCYREQVKRVQGWAIEATKEHPALPFLESMPGFGKVFAPLVAIEIDEIERFPSPAKLASYCGLVPTVRSSGGKTWVGGVGRQGNPWLKWAFIEGAWAAIRTSPYFRMHYQRLRQRKPATVAITATARRLCEIAFQLMKQRRCYEERYPAVV